MISSPELFQQLFGALVFIIVNLLYFLGVSKEFEKRTTLKFALSASSLLLISAIVGLRGEYVGVDTPNYALFYRGVSIKGLDEPLFFLLAAIFSSITEDTFLFFFSISLITNLFFLRAFMRLGRYYPAYIAFYCTFFLFANISVNIIRQGMAMGFVACAITALLTDRKREFFICSLLSLVTHMSSFFVIPLYVLYKIEKRYPEKAVVFLAAMAIFFYFFDITILFKILSPYSSIFLKAYWYLSWSEGKEWVLKHFYYLVLLMISFYTYITLYRRGCLSIITRKLFIYYLFGFVLVLVFKKEEMFADRLFYYFFFIVPLLVFSMLDYVKERKFTHLILLMVLNFWFYKSYVIQFNTWFITMVNI